MVVLRVYIHPHTPERLLVLASIFFGGGGDGGGRGQAGDVPGPRALGFWV